MAVLHSVGGLMSNITPHEGPQIKRIINETLKNFLETPEHHVFWRAEQLAEVDTCI